MMLCTLDILNLFRQHTCSVLVLVIEDFFGVAAECMEIKGIDHCYFYSRRSRNLVLLVLKDGRKYLVAPRDVEEFLNKLKMKNPYVICEHSGS